MHADPHRSFHFLRSSAPLLILLGAVACEENTTEIVVEPDDPIAEQLLTVSGQDLVGVVGTRSSEPIVVRVVSDTEIPIEGVRVLFSITSGEATVEDEVVTTDANGVSLTFVSFGETAGDVEVTATAPNLMGSPATFNLQAVAAAAARVLTVSGDEQTGTVGTALEESIVVRVVDAFGNSVVGQTVGFAVTFGNGSVGAQQVDTAEDGSASTTWTLGTTAGLQGLQVTVEGLSSAFFQAVAMADAPDAVLAVSGDSQGGVVGQALTEPFVVRVSDRFGNSVRDVLVRFAVSTGSGMIAPSEATTDFEGLAAATLTLGSVGDHAVEATVGALTPATFVARSFPVITLAPPTKTLTTVELSWTGTVADGFERFEVRRSLTSPVVETAELVASISAPTVRRHSDNAVEVGTRYFYRVYVHYAGGFRLPTNEASAEAGLSAVLGGVGWDVALDSANDRLYVSVPTLNEVTVVSATTFEVVDNIFVGSGPHGIELSQDGQRLFAALSGAGAVAVVDLSDNSVDTILLGNELGDDRAYDVISPRENVLVVTANAYSSGFSYVVRVDLDFVNGHTASRIAGGRIIRARPTLGMDPSGDFVYVSESFSPNSLYKLDMNTPGNPIILEDDHGSVSGTFRFDVSPDGLLLYTSSGQVLRTGSFNQAGTIARGIPLVSVDGTRCYMGRNGEIDIFNTTTFLQVGEIAVSGGAVDRMLFTDNGTTLVVLADDVLRGASAL